MSQDGFAIEFDSQGRLVLKRPGQDDVQDVRIRRAFPWSSPDRHISIRSAEGKELVLITDLAAEPEAVRTLVRGYLDKWVFVPQITRVIDVDMRFGFQQWKVETDRGPMEFRVQEREDIRFLGQGRFSIKDVDGCIYELPSIEALDEKSQRAIEVIV